MKTESTQAAADTWRSFVFPPSEGAVGFGFRDPGGVKAGEAAKTKNRKSERKQKTKRRTEMKRREGETET